MSSQRNTSPPAPVPAELAELEKLLGFQDIIRLYNGAAGRMPAEKPPEKQIRQPAHRPKRQATLYRIPHTRGAGVPLL